MKGLLAILAFFYVMQSHAQPVRAVSPSLDFRSANIAQVVQLIYGEVLDGAYVIDPEVLADSRTVSFRYDSSKGNVRQFIDTFFDSIGLVVTRRGGVDFISRKRGQEQQEESEAFVYRPKYRDGSYLSDLLGPLFKGSFTVRRTVQALPGNKSPEKAVPPGSAAAQIERQADMLVFSGSDKEISKLKAILPQVDVALGEVMVRAVLYEVSSNAKGGSGFSLAVNLLSGKLSAAIGVANLGDAFVRFKNQSIDTIYSALSTDTRFKVVSTPSLRVRSGDTGRFTVGQDVPVLGALSYPGNGQAPVQSIEYRSSGVIFDLQPHVHEAVVDLSVIQQVSNFVATDTGVNNSPTLIKREVKTALSLADGDVVVLGGLAENKESNGNSRFPFLPSLFDSKSSEDSRSEILLVLQIDKI